MKSYDGCWTCRLRKKRCDETRPMCRNCSALQITCHFGDEKPSWMDSGFGQKEKAEEVKREVRSAAARRRGIMLMDVLEPVAAEPTPDSSPAWTSTHTRPSTEPTSSNAHPDSWNGLDRLSVSNSSDEKPADSELDRRFMMFYFDHFFPFLFPFYKPLLLEGGRSWVMELVVGDQAMWHITLCLSTYFVSVALDGAISGHNVCKTLAWEKLLKQMGVTFMMLQRNLQEVASSDTPDMIVKTSRIMGSIIQLQRFEISVGNFENCRKHLDAAVTLFRQIFQDAENIVDRRDLPTFYSVLSHMGRPIWATTSQQSGAWNSDQAAFRFHSALLMVDDIIASTCMGESPRLLEYHAQLLTNCGGSDERPLLKLEDFIGCENWVILQIGEIAALDAWKKSMKEAGKLDMMELVARASVIKQALLARLDAPANTPKTNWLSLLTFYNDQLPPIPGGCTAFVTRVWAYAALLYLSVVVSGWQPGSAGVRDNVGRTLELLEQMPAPELLRTMVWPFCIVGCLAEPGEECRFRAMADAPVPHRLFGAARKALEIMENVWKCRDELTIDTDFAACICKLGYMPMLV
ncbi:MAG: hypothetical protein M1822_000487 [Bathelium mastoideum]|nr:MAG: hypothetical protein M1822_000487 [Bathelium mastoideum]